MTSGHDYTICRHFSTDRTCDLLLLFFFPDFGGSMTTATEVHLDHCLWGSLGKVYLKLALIGVVVVMVTFPGLLLSSDLLYLWGGWRVG